MKYYSESLKKLFDSEEEALEAEKTAEKEAKEKKAMVEIRKKQRAEDAKEVEDALKKVKEAEDEYHEKLNDFIKKYGYFHYSSKDANDFPSIFSVFEPFFTRWF